MLLVEEELLGFPGGSQVAFYAAFFASTGNLGRQNKTDLVGLAGLLAGFVYGVAGGLPHQPVACSSPSCWHCCSWANSWPTWPISGCLASASAGLQAGLALAVRLPGDDRAGVGLIFTTVQTRFWGLVVAGFTAVVVHAYLWPVLPMRHLRASIAAALRATAVSLAQLFRGPRSTWEGAPPSLE